MANLLTLEVFTPRGPVLAVETPYAILPGSEGELGILPGHIPLVTTLGSGVLKYEEAGAAKRAAVHYGYIRVQGDRVTVLAQMAELGVRIDRRRAENAEQRARETLRRTSAPQEEERARQDKYEAKLRRSLIRQQAAE